MVILQMIMATKTYLVVLKISCWKIAVILWRVMTRFQMNRQPLNKKFRPQLRFFHNKWWIHHSWFADPKLCILTMMKVPLVPCKLASKCIQRQKTLTVSLSKKVVIFLSLVDLATDIRYLTKKYRLNFKWMRLLQLYLDPWLVCRWDKTAGSLEMV